MATCQRKTRSKASEQVTYLVGCKSEAGHVIELQVPHQPESATGVQFPASVFLIEVCDSCVSGMTGWH